MTSREPDNKELVAELKRAQKQITELESKLNNVFKTNGHIKEIEEKYKFIVNAYGELMTLINRDYVYEMVNDSWCRTFGKSRKDFIGKTVAEVWGDHKFENEIKKKIDQCFLGNIYREEDSFIISGGKRRYYSVTYYPYQNEQGKITHIIGVTADITERKEAELALKQSEEELRNLNEKKDQYLSIINSDLETASNYVESLLPEEIYTSDLQVKWKIVPSAQLGGDSFGYHWIDNDHFAIYILDVTGHGVGAALHSVSVLNTLRFQTLVNIDFRCPDQVLKGLNNVFQMTDHYAMFVTMWYCVFCRSKHEIKCAGAGHPPLLVFKSEDKPYRITSQNIMVGAEKDYHFQDNTIRVVRGMVLYLYTDGVFEVKLPDGNLNEIENLENLIAKNLKKRSNELDVLYNNMIDLNAGNGLVDDFTIIKVHFR